MRFRPVLGKLVDHRVRVLVSHGQIRRGERRKCALTDNDLFTQLRQRGVFWLANLRYVLYESKGDMTVVKEDAPSDGELALVKIGLDDAVSYP